MLDWRTTARWFEIPLRTVQWSSALIVLGCTSYFIGTYREGQHLIYELVVAALSVIIFFPAFIHPLLPKSISGFGLSAEVLYSILWATGVILSFDVMFSYLWLTAFVFTAQDYNWEDCTASAPPGGPCSIKKAVQSFTFLAFFSSFLAYFVDVVLMWSYQRIAAGNDIRQPGDLDQAI